MTKYIKLTREDNIYIGIVFGGTVGAVSNRNKESIKIGKQIVGEVQRKCFHSRDTMRKRKKWEPALTKAIEQFTLTREDGEGGL
jgi:hypothetical protein